MNSFLGPGLFAICIACFGWGAKQLLVGVPELLEGIRTGKEKRLLLQALSMLRELEETLAAGLVPPQERWASLSALGPPWGRLASESLSELRSSGGALLPTLGRLRNLADAHLETMIKARARASQALAQAGFCAVTGPLFGVILFWIFPGVAERPWSWAGACAFVFVLSAVGAIWMVQLSENARWGGLTGDSRAWPLAAQCGGERLLALVRSGHPPDLAWGKAYELLEREAPKLAAKWGGSVWQSSEERPPGTLIPSAERVLIEAGDAIRKSIQVSLMEGRPCGERVESVLRTLRSDFDAQVERELGLLGTRVLKPLFLCVAPGILGLLGMAMWFGFEQAIGS